MTILLNLYLGNENFYFLKFIFIKKSKSKGMIMNMVIVIVLLILFNTWQKLIMELKVIIIMQTQMRNNSVVYVKQKNRL